jgi:arabinose-5-phosphate isomerase
MLTDPNGCLVGLFTDSDLARLYEQGREGAIAEPIERVMTRSPLTIASGSSVQEAWRLLSGRKISELPVVDGAGHPLGLIDITDTLSLGQPPRTSTTSSVDRSSHDIAAPHLLPFSPRVEPGVDA